MKELLVISQNKSAYGVDLKYAASKWRDREVRAKFIDLASAFGELGVWVRLRYVYPYPHVDDVIPLMAEREVLRTSTSASACLPGRPQTHATSGGAGRNLERIARWREHARI